MNEFVALLHDVLFFRSVISTRDWFAGGLIKSS